MLNLRLLAIVVSFTAPYCLFATEEHGHSHDHGDNDLNISVSIDAMGEFNADRSSVAKDRFDIREVEVSFQGPVDDYFDGELSIAAHNEEGTSMFEIHEAYLSSSLLISDSSFKIGQFFLGVGRLNRVHRHEWPMIRVPKVQAEFFGEEGVLDTGAEYTYSLPSAFKLSLTAGITNGWTYGHTHSEGTKPRMPTHYARLGSELESLFGGKSQLGLSYVGRKTSDDIQLRLVGVDGIAKWPNAGAATVTIQSEAWMRWLSPAGGKTSKALGVYAMPQFAITAKAQFGALIEYYTILNLEDLLGKRIANSEYAVTPTIGINPSEYSSFRIGYGLTYKEVEDQSTQVDRRFLLQLTYNMGAHKEHGF